MSRPLEILCRILSAVEFTLGILGNGFIVLINSIDWIRQRKISLVDFILTCLAASRICFLWTVILVISFDLISEKTFPSQSTLMSVVFFWSGSSYLCTACTTCLSVFYVFKIAHFSHPIFLWMKHRMRKMLLIIMLGTILTFCTHVIVMNTLTNSLIPGRMEMSTNSTLSLIGAFDEQLKHQFLLHMTLVILFVVSLTSFLLLIFSLWSHSRRMKLQGVYSRDSSTEAHVRAMRAMALYLFLFVMHYVSNVMMLSSYSTLGTVVTKNFAQLLIFFYPSGHPFLLILWNKKLKQAFLCVLGKLKCVREKSISHSSECT